jgi:AraC-like DNA-binding protein
MERVEKNKYTNSFEMNILPELVYVCRIALDEDGQELHSHAEHAELFLVCSGTAVAEVDGRQEELETGDFVLCDAGKLHSFHAETHQPTEAIACGFSHLHCRGAEENCLISENEQPIVHAGAGSLPLIHLLEVLEETAADPNPQGREVCGYLSAAAVTMALRIHHVAAERIEQAHFDLGVRTRLYLDRHYLDPLTLDGIAKAMGVSKYHLDRVFLQTVGCTPVQYITRRRIARAQTLLTATNDTIQQIAAQCGYNNYNYFTVLFRKNTGKTPGEYRKIIQGRTSR